MIEFSAGTHYLAMTLSARRGKAKADWCQMAIAAIGDFGPKTR